MIIVDHFHADMYSFDVSEEAAKETYVQVCKAYEQILQRLKLPVVKGKIHLPDY